MKGTDCDGQFRHDHTYISDTLYKHPPSTVPCLMRYFFSILYAALNAACKHILKNIAFVFCKHYNYLLPSPLLVYQCREDGSDLLSRHTVFVRIQLLLIPGYCLFHYF